ncbi:MAG: serine hydrolase domain-containing protein [Desulfomonilia bacterium]
MKRKWRGQAAALCILVVSALLAWGCASLPARPDFTRTDSTDITRYLSTYIEKSMKTNDIVGLSIALVDVQELLWARGFGYADKENNVPATKNTVYRVGSISKLFTATAVMKLAQEGKVDIDAPLVTYVPEFSMRTRYPNSSAITPRHIMTHHSGLPTDYLNGMFARSPERLEGLVSRLHDEYTAFPPGYVFCYSNIAVSILGLLVETASKREFSSYMHEELLHPLGMSRSSFTRSGDASGLLARSYAEGDVQEQFLLRDMPAGSLYSSVADMSRFISMVFAEGSSAGTQILQPETLEEMLRVQTTDTPLDADTKIGLNWLIQEKEGMGTIVGHSGGVVSFHSHLYAVPGEKIAVIVMTNCVEGAHASGEICMEALESLHELKSGEKIPEKQEPDPEANIPEQRLKEFEGTYDTIVGSLSLKKKGGRLVTSIRGDSFILFPRQDGTFGMKYLLLGFLPWSRAPLDSMSISFEDASGHRIIVNREGNTRTRIGSRIERVEIPGAWQQRLGRYSVINLGDNGLYVKSVTLRMEDGFLLADVVVSDHEDAPLTVALDPIDHEQAVVMGLGRNRGDTYTIRDSGTGEVLHAYGFDFRYTGRE